MSHPLPVAKGHGTENDFVLLPDPDGALDLTPALVAALCDRRAGLGGDGVIRVVRSKALPEGRAQADEAEWFMDYRNGDGSPAQMCGNGVRVFATYLLQHGLAEAGPDGRLPVATRAGVKQVTRAGGELSADLGPWHLAGGAAAQAAGSDVTVAVAVTAGEPLVLPGLSVDLGNPHVVVALPGADVLAAADLARAPRVQPAPPEGVNVELVVPRHLEHGHGHLLMRVHERGVGETRSCGTGAVAAVVAARAWAGEGAPPIWWVDVPGGRLTVTVPEDGPGGPGALVAGRSALLAGPATIVAEGTLDPGWLAARGA